MRLFRALLAILVGLSLTLICQGHETTGKHSRPHISLLGEGKVAHEHQSLAASAINTNPSSQVNHAHPPHEHLAPALSNAISSMPQPVEVIGSTMLDVAHGADSVSVQVAIIFVALFCLLRRYSVASGRQTFLAAGTGPPPAHPPPRFFSLSPAS